MRFGLALLLVSLPVAASAQDEDAAHRADRLRTEQLNRDAAHAVARRDQGNDDALDRYAAARRDYDKAMRAWRQRVADCEAGEVRACDVR